MSIKKILHLTFALGLCQCSPSKSDQRGRTAPPFEQEPSAPADAPITEIPLLQLPATGSHMRFLDALALTEIYSRIFPKDANGHWKGCPSNDDWCKKSMFSNEEAKFLGTFSLVDGVDSFQIKKDFTLNYTRNLRAMLYRECRNLVDSEWQRISTPDSVTQNVLIARQGVPETADLDRFSRRLFGLDGTTMPIDNMADAYRAAFATSVAAKPEPMALKSGYVTLCMAMAMDPAVFLY